MMQSINNSLTQYVASAHAALESPAFDLNAPESALWKPEFMQLIALVHSVLTLADQAGKRVNFLDSVGVHGKLQDITSLVSWMHAQLPQLTVDKPEQPATNRLNRYANQGWGYFANGCFFAVEFNNELAFFIDDQRVYLNHHLRRALAEVEHSFGIRL